MLLYGIFTGALFAIVDRTLTSRDPSRFIGDIPVLILSSALFVLAHEQSPRYEIYQLSLFRN